MSNKPALYSQMISRVASYLKNCDSLIVFSGAGMSVDSGLPDFASDHGIIQKIINNEKNMEYRDIINPKYFQDNPRKFWYIYGDRYNQYNHAIPHNGY